MIQKLRTATAFFVLWLGVSYVFALISSPLWLASHLAIR
jgi:hypothetical protein